MLKRLQYYLLLLLPLLYLSYIVYLRIILKRLPRDLELFKNNFLLIITTIVIIFFLLRIYLLLKNLEILKVRESRNKYIQLIKLDLRRLKIHIELTVEEFFRVLAINTKWYNGTIFRFIQYIFLHIPSKKYTVAILFIDGFSKAIVILAFLVDVFYFKQLNYFYKTLSLLLLPLLLDIIQSASMQYYRDNIVRMISYLDSEPIEGTEFYDFCYNENMEIPDYFSEVDYYFHCIFIPVYEVPYNIANRWEIHDEFRIKHINLLICILYLIGWSYIWLIGMGYLS